MHYAMPLFEKGLKSSYPHFAVDFPGVVRKITGADDDDGVARVEYFTPSPLRRIRLHLYRGPKGEESCYSMTEYSSDEKESLNYLMTGPPGEERIFSTYDYEARIHTLYEGPQGAEAMRICELPDDHGIEHWEGERGKEYIVKHVLEYNDVPLKVNTYYSTDDAELRSQRCIEFVEKATDKLKFKVLYEGIGRDVYPVRVEDWAGFISYIKNNKVYKVVEPSGNGFKLEVEDSSAKHAKPPPPKHYTISSDGKLSFELRPSQATNPDFVHMASNVLAAAGFNVKTIIYLTARYMAENIVPSLRLKAGNGGGQDRLVRSACERANVSYEDVKEVIEMLRVQEEAKQRRQRALELIEVWRSNTWRLILERRTCDAAATGPDRVRELMDAWRRETQRLIRSRRARSPYHSLSWAKFRRCLREEKASAQRTEQHELESKERTERRRLAAEAKKNRLERLEATASFRDACRHLSSSSSASSTPKLSSDPGVNVPGVIGQTLSDSDRLLADALRETSKYKSIRARKEFEREKLEMAKKQCELAEKREEQIRIGDRIMHGK